MITVRFIVVHLSLPTLFTLYSLHMTEPYYFTFARDPKSRALAAYAEVDSKVEAYRNGVLKQGQNDHQVQDIKLIYTYLPVTSGEVRLNAYLDDLLLKAFGTREQSSFHVFQPTHSFPLAHHFKTKGLNFIGHVESFCEGWHHLAAKVGTYRSYEDGCPMSSGCNLILTLNQF